MTEHTFKPTVNDAFIAACFSFDNMIAVLQRARADHFDAEADNTTWADVGSLSYINDCLANAVNFVSGTVP